MKDYVYIIIITILVFIIGILIGLNISKTNDDIKLREEKEYSEKLKQEKEIEYNEEIKDETIIDSQIKKENTYKKEETKLEYTNKDVVVIKVLENTLSNVVSKVNNDEFRKSIKVTIVNIIDFIFYDGTINGVAFKELSNNGKEKVLTLANKIDIAIESKIPDYKDNISNTASNAYKKALDLIKEGSNNFNSFLINKLSEDDYNSIINAKDELVEYSKKASSFVKNESSKLFNESKNKLKDWYIRYKNS